MFAEMKLELQDRGTAKNVTDVVTLEAELLGIETQAYDYLPASNLLAQSRKVNMASLSPSPRCGILRKPINGQTGWVLAGIQQLN